VWYINAATDEQKIYETIELIYNEMKTLRTTHSPKQHELSRAKQQLKSATIIELESMAARMNNLIKQHCQVGEYESTTDIIAKIDAVTLDDVMNIYEQYFTDDAWYQTLLIPEQD
jgi:predicted Zn-dependent peptidase